MWHNCCGYVCGVQILPKQMVGSNICASTALLIVGYRPKQIVGLIPVININSWMATKCLAQNARNYGWMTAKLYMWPNAYVSQHVREMLDGGSCCPTIVQQYHLRQVDRQYFDDLVSLQPPTHQPWAGSDRLLHHLFVRLTPGCHVAVWLRVHLPRSMNERELVPALRPALPGSIY